MYIYIHIYTWLYDMMCYCMICYEMICHNVYIHIHTYIHTINIKQYQPLVRGLSVSMSLRFLCRPKEVFLKRVIWLVYFAVLALVLRLIHDLLELTGFPDFVFVLDFGFYQFTHVSMCYSTSVYPFPHFPGPTRAQRGETEAAG